MKRFSFVLLCLLLTTMLSAQTEDMESWWNFTLKGRFNKKLSYALEPEVRLYDNSSRIRNWQTEGSLSYELLGDLDIGALYRYSVNTLRPELNRREHRVSLFVKYKLKTGKADWRYRGTWQNEYTNYNRSVDGRTNHMGHRHKFSVAYTDKDWPLEPQIGIEYFFALSPYDDLGEWKQRWYVSLERKISKRWTASFSYRRQTEYMVTDPLTRNMLGISIEYEPKFLKGKKTKKK